MKNPTSFSQPQVVYPTRLLALLLATFLLIEGVWGFVSPVVFGVLSTNHLHACIHVALGLGGIWASSTGRSKGFLLFVGALLAVVGALWFIPISRALVMNLFAVNKAVALVNLIIGTVCLLVVFNTNRLETASEQRW